MRNILSFTASPLLIGKVPLPFVVYDCHTPIRRFRPETDYSWVNGLTSNVLDLAIFLCFLTFSGSNCIVSPPAKNGAYERTAFYFCLFLPETHQDEQKFCQQAPTEVLKIYREETRSHKKIDRPFFFINFYLSWQLVRNMGRSERTAWLFHIWGEN